MCYTTGMTDQPPFDFDGFEQGPEYECKRKPRRCPACGSTRVASILYGMPLFSEDLQRRLDDGTVVLGGCSLDSAKWECVDCHAQMHPPSDPDAWR